MNNLAKSAYGISGITQASESPIVCRTAQNNSRPKRFTGQKFEAKQFGFGHCPNVRMSEPEFHLQFGQPEPESVYPNPTRFSIRTRPNVRILNSDKNLMTKPGFIRVGQIRVFGSDNFLPALFKTSSRIKGSLDSSVLGWKGFLRC